MTSRIGIGLAEIRLASHDDYSTMKARIIREARIAQAAAIRAAFAATIASVIAFATRLNRPPCPSPEPEHGD
jgi:hypothetical protein